MPAIASAAGIKMSGCLSVCSESPWQNSSNLAQTCNGTRGWTDMSEVKGRGYRNPLTAESSTKKMERGLIRVQRKLFDYVDDEHQVTDVTPHDRALHRSPHIWWVRKEMRLDRCAEAHSCQAAIPGRLGAILNQRQFSSIQINPFHQTSPSHIKGNAFKFCWSSKAILFISWNKKHFFFV